MLFVDKTRPVSATLEEAFPGYDKELVREVLRIAAAVARNCDENDLRTVAARINLIDCGDVSVDEYGCMVWL